MHGARRKKRGRVSARDREKVEIVKMKSERSGVITKFADTKRIIKVSYE